MGQNGELHFKRPAGGQPVRDRRGDKGQKWTFGVGKYRRSILVSGAAPGEKGYSVSIGDRILSLPEERSKVIVSEK